MLPTPRIEPIVLIVNDDPSTRNWIEAIVTSVGLRAVSFDTGADLLLHVNAGTVACAILDVNLPDRSGLELQCELARAGVPALFLTRQCCFAACVRAIKAGAVDFLTVPCNSLALVQALRHAMSQAKTSFEQRVRIDELRCRYERLTPRERQVFTLVSTGLRNKQIAYRLDISNITVQIHRGQVMRKMEAHSFAALVRMATVLQLQDDDASVSSHVTGNRWRSSWTRTRSFSE